MPITSTNSPFSSSSPDLRREERRERERCFSEVADAAAVERVQDGSLGGQRSSLASFVAGASNRVGVRNPEQWTASNLLPILLRPEPEATT